MNTPVFRAAFAAFFGVLLAACKGDEQPSPVPSISFVSLDPRVVKAASPEDTAYLEFRFSDGDADLGVESSSGEHDVFLVDSRDSQVRSLFFPEINDELRDPAKGMTGTAIIILEAALLYPREDSLHLATGDTLRYEVYVRDRAGNESNHFTTPEIILTPP